MTKIYKPISCDYVDYIEHLATLKKEVSIKYLEALETLDKKEDVLITWKNESGIEYLYTKSGLKIRLDHIVAINGKKPGDDCSL